jgi:hypothetical protein
LYFSRDLDENDATSIAEALQAMPETCALDVADRGGMTLEGVAELLGMRKQSVDEVVTRAARAIRDSGVEFDEREHPEDFYTRYSNMGAAELAEVAAELRRRNRRG